MDRRSFLRQTAGAATGAAALAMGEARNNINVLSSDVVFACGMGAGTASEVALAVKGRRHVILLNVSDQAARFFVELDPNRVHVATGAGNAVDTARHLLY